MDFYNDFGAYMRWRMLFLPPVKPVLITGIIGEDPKVILGELREEDPDAYALLTEHIVLEDS